jgi:hypothetical protein
MSEKNKLDKFYTKSKIVDLILQKIDFDEFNTVIEPAAGSGQFLKKMPENKSFGFDLSPETESDNIIEADFLEVNLDEDLLAKGKILSLGNPPFGKNASLAVKFFNKCASFSSCISFILPRTFRKPSVINRLDENFFLEEEIILPLDSFYTPEGIDYAVPTVFQIWRRRDTVRKKIDIIKQHEDFTFCKPIKKKNPWLLIFLPKCIHVRNLAEKNSKINYRKLQNEADFCVRRVGAAAGTVFMDFKKIKRDYKSHYYIKGKRENVIDIFKAIDWLDPLGCKYDTVGNPSVSKHELILAYNKKKKQLN